MMALRWGICSTGLVAQDFANALNIAPDRHSLHAVSSRTLEHAQAFAKRFAVAKAYDSVSQMAADPSVDVIYVATLTHLHRRVVEECLLAGKHVLCEKPMGLSRSECNQLVEIARERRLFLMEGLWSRFFPAYQQLQQLIADGSLGCVKLLQANFHGPAASVPRLRQRELGGGGLLDFGVYLVQLAQWVFQGEAPVQVRAAGLRFADSGVDESANVTLLYSGNRMATLCYSLDCQGDTTAHVYGSQGDAHLEPQCWCPTRLRLKDETRELPTRTAEGKESWNFWECGGFLYEADHVKLCLDQGLTESPVISLDDSLQFREIMDDVLSQLGVSYDEV